MDVPRMAFEDFISDEMPRQAPVATARAAAMKIGGWRDLRQLSTALWRQSAVSGH